MSRRGTWLLAPAGLLLVGAGVSVAVDAASLRARGEPTPRWVRQGTAGLVLLNGGLCLFGDAVRRHAVAEAGRRPARRGQ